MAAPVSAGVLAWPNWVPVRAEHGWLLLALAGTGFIAQLCITEAFRHGQASAVAPVVNTSSTRRMRRPRIRRLPPAVTAKALRTLSRRPRADLPPWVVVCVCRTRASGR